MRKVVLREINASIKIKYNCEKTFWQVQNLVSYYLTKGYIDAENVIRVNGGYD